MDQDKKTDARPNAWVLDFGQTHRAAVGMRVLMQIIDSPRLHPVPCAPAHCRSVFSWQGRLLPVLDMAPLLGHEPTTPPLLAVAGYQEHAGEAMRFGAFLLATPPVAIIVGNDQACALPEEPAIWQKLSLSCFGHQGDAIPVLHLSRLFSRPIEAR